MPDVEPVPEEESPTAAAGLQIDHSLELVTPGGAAFKAKGDPAKRIGRAATFIGAFCVPILAVTWGAHQVITVPKGQWWIGFIILGIGIIAGTIFVALIPSAENHAGLGGPTGAGGKSGKTG